MKSQTMQSDRVDQQLIEAEMTLARALQRLSALRRAALYGSFDDAAFDRAVRDHRAAEARLAEARRAKERQVEGGVATVTAPGAPPASVDEQPPDLQPTPRLLFARWLVQTGRLSDWDAS
jgi:hypothetical protein